MNRPERYIAELKAEHTKDAINHRLSAGPRHSYLRDFVYGAIDGAVTTFAIVSGVAGAGLSAGVVLVLGVANLVADGFSMAVSNYLGTRAEHEQREHARRVEEAHVEHFPEGEREEIRQIFAAKGFSGADLEHVVDVITSDVTRWVDTMLKEELGLSLTGPSPRRAALATFVAFVVVGSLPLLTFVVRFVSPDSVEQPFLWSSVLTGVGFFFVGALKSRFVKQPWLVAGLETLLMGGIASVLAYAIGFFLRGVAGAV